VQARDVMTPEVLTVAAETSATDAGVVMAGRGFGNVDVAEDLDRTTARAVIALANRAPSVHNTQPWRWRIEPSSIHLYADLERALPATDPGGRDLRLSCGAALHHLRMALLAAGLRSTVHRLPEPARPEHLAAVETHPGRPTPEDLALARAMENRRTDRRMFSSWPVPPEMLADLVRRAAEQGALLTVLDRESVRYAVTRLIEHADVEQALTPDLAQETAEWTGRSRGAHEGVPAANVPAGPAGTVPVRRFGGGEQEQSLLGRYESDGTVLALLSTTGDGVIDQLRAGEALSAVLLRATHFGLATDPISQPLEVPATRSQLQATAVGGSAAPQVLLRLGWAPMSTVPVPRTGRRPLADTIDPLH
jgi:CBS domain-containing protein